MKNKYNLTKKGCGLYEIYWGCIKMKLKQKIAIILLATFVFTNFNQGIKAMAETLERVEFNIKYEANKNLLTKNDILNGENTESGVITEEDKGSSEEEVIELREMLILVVLKLHQVLL